jgi:peptidoglycan/LPS O-acetylase OafA/YrhL
MSASAPALRPTPAPFHRPELDALRFGAFFLVFLHHAMPHSSSAYPVPFAPLFAAIARAGALGVDLFFALSAYLITEILLREHSSTGSIDVRAFYLRRILRIWPLYFVALFALAPLMPHAMPAGHIAAYALLAGNWACAFAGYPASPFALLWSVSIEEQFYLVWPWLVSKGVRQAAIAMLIVAFATRLILAATAVEHPGVWCNTLARLDPIACGALLAVSGREPVNRTFFLAAGAVGFTLAGGFGSHDGWGSLWTYPLASASATAILHGVLGLGRDFGFGYLGKISFGLYVFHAAALELASNAFVGLVLTIAAAALSYRFLEMPFLRLKQRFARS